MRKIVFTRPDGGLTVMSGVKNIGEKISDREAEQRAWLRLPADAINPRWVNADEIPSDRTFRNAWKSDLTVDMSKAREIHKARLRALREPLLRALDVQFMKALEAGLPTEEIVAKKEALRDVTEDPSIGAAETPEDLKKAIPSSLLG
jgi:hypothetical protein